MNRIISFFKGKGFYLALSLCILAAAGSSFWAIRNVMQKLGEGGTSQVEQGGTQQWDIPGAQVEEKVNDVPKPSARPSQGSQSQSGAGAQQGQAGGSGEPADAAVPSFVKPVAGQIVQGFRGEELVYNATLGDWRTHNGVDMSCAADAAVKSAVAGKVVNMYEDGLWGQVVEVDAGETVWRYTGLDKTTLKVNTGDELEAGQMIGKIGETMAETGAETHLHLEVLKGGNYVDPEHYFQ